MSRVAIWWNFTSRLLMGVLRSITHQNHLNYLINDGLEARRRLMLKLWKYFIWCIEIFNKFNIIISIWSYDYNLHNYCNRRIRVRIHSIIHFKKELWIFSIELVIGETKYPIFVIWKGSTKSIYHENKSAKSAISYLQIINSKPENFSTVFTTILIQECMQSAKSKPLITTFFLCG